MFHEGTTKNLESRRPLTTLLKLKQVYEPKTPAKELGAEITVIDLDSESEFSTINLSSDSDTVIASDTETEIPSGAESDTEVVVIRLTSDFNYD